MNRFMGKNIKMLKSSALQRNSKIDKQVSLNDSSITMDLKNSNVARSNNINESLNNLSELKILQNISINQTHIRNRSNNEDSIATIKMDVSNLKDLRLLIPIKIKCKSENSLMEQDMTIVNKPQNCSNLSYNNLISGNINNSSELNSLLNLNNSLKITNDQKKNINSSVRLPKKVSLISEIPVPPIIKEVKKLTLIPIRSTSTIPLPMEFNKYLVENNIKDRTHKYNKYILLQNYSKGFSYINNEKNQSAYLKSQIRRQTKAINPTDLINEFIPPKQDENFIQKRKLDERLNKNFLL